MLACFETVALPKRWQRCIQHSYGHSPDCRCVPMYLCHIDLVLIWLGWHSLFTVISFAAMLLPTTILQVRHTRRIIASTQPQVDLKIWQKASINSFRSRFVDSRTGCGLKYKGGGAHRQRPSYWAGLIGRGTGNPSSVRDASGSTVDSYLLLANVCRATCGRIDSRTCVFCRRVPQECFTAELARSYRRAEWPSISGITLMAPAGSCN